MSLVIPTEPATHDLTLLVGSTFEISLGLTATDTGLPLDLTGLTARAKCCDDFGSSPFLTLTCAITTPATAGVIVISATIAEIASIPAPTPLKARQRVYQIGVWDLEITDGTKVARYLQGTVSWSREATV